VIVLHAAAIMRGNIGGAEAAVPALIAAQNRCTRVQSALLVTIPGKESLPRPGFPVFDGEPPVAKSGRLGLPAPFDRPQLVVFHGTYVPAQSAIARKLKRAGIPYVICPHGGMTRFAQATKAWKKRIANILFFNSMVKSAEALHCLTQGEAEASSQWKRPIFVVGNGVELPPKCELASPGNSRSLRLLFLGRMEVRIKGLDMLLDACRLLRPALVEAGARLELCGPDWQGSTRLLAERITTLGLENIVSLSKPVVGEAKRALFRTADVFLHPSRSEGHPMAVLEALAHGVPCLLTPNTNVAAEVVSAGAGWQVDPSAPGIADGLSRLLSLEKRHLAKAGARARRLAETQYDWRTVADRTVQAYRRFAA